MGFFGGVIFGVIIKFVYGDCVCFGKIVDYYFYDRGSFLKFVVIEFCVGKDVWCVYNIGVIGWV